MSPPRSFNFSRVSSFFYFPREGCWGRLRNGFSIDNISGLSCWRGLLSCCSVSTTPLFSVRRTHWPTMVGFLWLFSPESPLLGHLSSDSGVLQRCSSAVISKDKERKRRKIRDVIQWGGCCSLRKSNNPVNLLAAFTVILRTIPQVKVLCCVRSYLGRGWQIKIVTCKWRRVYSMKYISWAIIKHNSSASDSIYPRWTWPPRKLIHSYNT